MEKIHVSLRPLVHHLNLPTVIKTAILPDDSYESLFIATQVGEIYYLRNGEIKPFIDIRHRIIELGSNGGYDERGLIGVAFHPDFQNNGLFYLHYTLAGTQGPGALSKPFKPDPCVPSSLNLTWNNRGNQYDHIDTVEEWFFRPSGQHQRKRTLLNIIRPFMNHNGVNSLIFSPETGKLILTTGDGGSGYDPFNLSQNIMEIAGKIIEINVDIPTTIDNPPAVSRFIDLPSVIQRTLSVIAIGGRNYSGIHYKKQDNHYIKYVGNVGQDLVETIFSFIYYEPIPVTEIVRGFLENRSLNLDGIINFGWRGWEGDLPTSIIRDCGPDSNFPEKIIAYYDEAIDTSTRRLQPLACYYHYEERPDKFIGTALTGVQPYMGNEIPDLASHIVFIDLVMAEGSQPPIRGVLACTKDKVGCVQSDYCMIEIDYDFGSQPAFYVSLGANQAQTKLYLGVYGSTNVADMNLGTVFEIENTK